MDAKVEVFQAVSREGISKKTGNGWKMTVCQCLVETPDGQKMVGELILPKNHPEVRPGKYVASFGLQISQDKRISGQVMQLTPVAAVRAA